jgi:hypothetical protein
MNYLLGYIIFKIGKTLVELRKVDFWINATHVIYAAGRTRNTLTTLRKNIGHEIVNDHGSQGTYVVYQDGLQLSIKKKYKLNAITEGLERIMEDRWQEWLTPPTRPKIPEPDSTEIYYGPPPVATRHRGGGYRGQDTRATVPPTMAVASWNHGYLEEPQL